MKESLASMQLCSDVDDLVDAIATDLNAEDFDLSFTGIGDNEAVKIAAALEKNSTMRCINLANNHIKTNGANALAKVLQGQGAKSCTIRKLNLSNNAIGYQGANYIADALASAETLEELNLSGNALGNAGVLAILKNCINAKNLKKVDISNNGIHTLPGDDENLIVATGAEDDGVKNLDNELADLKEELDKEDGPRIHIIVDQKLADMIGDRMHLHAPDNE